MRIRDHLQWKQVTEDKDAQVKAQFLGLREDSTLKADFQDPDLATFWLKASLQYPRLPVTSLRFLIPFASRYHCEADFSTVVNIKTKARNIR
jgi:hypothetical protein